jgi:hypothetical protein
MRTSSEHTNNPAMARPHAAWRCAAVLLLALGMAVPALAAGTCGARPCLTAMSVVGAAGDDFRAALAKVAFVGDQLAPQSQDAVATMAKTWTAHSKKVLSLRVRADRGLNRTAAHAQAAARAQALTAALVAAGLPEKQIKVAH